MKTLEKNKGIVVAVILFALLMALYNFFKVDIFPESLPPENVGADLIELYAGLQNVSFNEQVFSSPLYNALTDFSVELGPEPVGRSNPFNIIGTD